MDAVYLKLVAIGAILAFALAELVTRGLIYTQNSNRSGIYVLMNGTYYRVHHYELGLLVIVASIILLGIESLALRRFIPQNSLTVSLMVFLGIGIGILISGILDILI
ncbi:MAG: hypothetical protein ACREBH_02645 [Candidatus Micrarchaeaceae archaeon]